MEAWVRAYAEMDKRYWGMPEGCGIQRIPQDFSPSRTDIENRLERYVPSVNRAVYDRNYGNEDYYQPSYSPMYDQYDYNQWKHQNWEDEPTTCYNDYSLGHPTIEIQPETIQEDSFQRNMARVAKSLKTLEALISSDNSLRPSTFEIQPEIIQENSIQNSFQTLELSQQNTLQRLQELMKDIQQGSSQEAIVKNSGIWNEELDPINEHMVEFPDESISMTVQKNGEDTWISFKYSDDDTLHSHDTQDFNDEVEVSLFEPQPNLGIECEERNPIPSMHCTELDYDEYWDDNHECAAPILLKSISSLVQVNDQDVHEVIGHNEPLPSPDMSDLKVEDEPLTTDLSNSCETCLDHSPKLNDDMIREMDEPLDMTLKVETTLLRPPHEPSTFDNSTHQLSSFNEQSDHNDASPNNSLSVCAGLEQERVHLSTFKDDGFLGQIITSSNVENQSHSAELTNSWDCLAYFADSNDLMSKDKVDALQDNVLVVITNQENPYSEDPSSRNHKCHVTILLG